MGRSAKVWELLTWNDEMVMAKCGGLWDFRDPGNEDRRCLRQGRLGAGLAGMATILSAACQGVQRRTAFGRGLQSHCVELKALCNIRSVEPLLAIGSRFQEAR